MFGRVNACPEIAPSRAANIGPAVMQSGAIIGGTALAHTIDAMLLAILTPIDLADGLAQYPHAGTQPLRDHGHVGVAG
jgi:hypothetical protein